MCMWQGTSSKVCVRHRMVTSPHNDMLRQKRRDVKHKEAEYQELFLPITCVACTGG